MSAVAYQPMYGAVIAPHTIVHGVGLGRNDGATIIQARITALGDILHSPFSAALNALRNNESLRLLTDWQLWRNGVLNHQSGMGIHQGVELKVTLNGNYALRLLTILVADEEPLEFTAMVQEVVSFEQK